jgi:hypothetical protein
MYLPIRTSQYRVLFSTLPTVEMRGRRRRRRWGRRGRRRGAPVPPPMGVMAQQVKLPWCNIGTELLAF